MLDNIMIWHAVFIDGKVYTRSSWQSRLSWDRNPVVETMKDADGKILRDKDGKKMGLTYREKHIIEPPMYELYIPDKFVEMLANRDLHNRTYEDGYVRPLGRPVEFTYGQLGEDLHAISIVTPPDTFERYEGRKRIRIRLNRAANSANYDSNIIAHQSIIRSKPTKK